MHLKFWTNYDYGTTRVVNTLTKQVLTEATLFTLEHIGQGFEGPVTRTCYRTTTTAIIDQGINRFLQHAFFVAHDDIRSAQFEQAFQAIIPVDNTTIEVVKVRGSKATAIKLYHWSQFWWNYWHDIHNHPFRTIARLTEGFNHFQTANSFNFALTTSGFQFRTKLVVQSIQVKFRQKGLDSFSTHIDTYEIKVFCRTQFVALFTGQFFVFFICFSNLCVITQFSVVSFLTARFIDDSQTFTSLSYGFDYYFLAANSVAFFIELSFVFTEFIFG